jgi:hypothetical protein
METQSLNSLVKTIFTGPPRPQCTYTIAISDDQNTTLFQLLMSVLITGAKFLYGESITPSDISQEQFDELKLYMESMGYKVKHNYTNIGDENIPNELKPRIINIWFEAIPPPRTDCHGRRIYY